MHEKVIWDWSWTEVKSMQTQPSCKKSAAHAKKRAWKKLWNPKWWPRSGCDGRIMAIFLITTIQVNLVLIPSEAWRRQHKFAWIVVIKNFAIILPSQPLLGHHLGFHNFFHAVFLLHGSHLFYSLAVFVQITFNGGFISITTKVDLWALIYYQCFGATICK